MVSSIKSGSGFSQQVERHLDTEGWEVVGQKQLAQSVVLLDARLQTELGVSAQVLVMVVEGANTAVGKTHLSHLSQYETKVGADGAALVAQAGYDETFRESAEMQNIKLLEPDEIESSLKRFLTPTISSADISRRHVLTIGGIAAIGGLVGIGIRNDLTSSIPAISGNESNFPAADSVPSLDNSQHDAIEVVEKVLKASYEDDTNTIEEYHHPDLGDDRVISRTQYSDATGEASFEIQELYLTEEDESVVVVTAEVHYDDPIEPSQDTWEFVLTQTEDSDWRICNGEQTAGANHGLSAPLPNGCSIPSESDDEWDHSADTGGSVSADNSDNNNRVDSDVNENGIDEASTDEAEDVLRQMVEHLNAANLESANELLHEESPRTFGRNNIPSDRFKIVERELIEQEDDRVIFRQTAEYSGQTATWDYILKLHKNMEWKIYDWEIVDDWS